MKISEILNEDGDDNWLGIDWSKPSAQRQNVQKASMGEPGSEKEQRIKATIQQDTEEIKNWAKQKDAIEKAKHEKINFLGISDMLKADELKRKQAAGATTSVALKTPITGPLSGGGPVQPGAGNLLHQINPQKLY